MKRASPPTCHHAYFTVASLLRISMPYLVLFIVLTGCGKVTADGGSTSPNILFIMADDHATQAFGIYHSRLADLNPTPVLDAIAREGMVFDNCFVNNSICVPSRAAILTGQHAQTNGVIDLEGHLDPEHQYLPQEMKKLGYHTAIIGKWHLEKEPAAFEHYQVLPSQGKYFNPEFRLRGEKPWPENIVVSEGHSTDIITDLSLNWLRDGWDKKRPFFLMHHFKAPHDDFEYAPRYVDYLEDVHIPEPESLYERRNHGSEATRGHKDSLTRIIGSSVSHRNLIRHQAMNIYWNDSSIYKKYGEADAIRAEEYMAWEINEAERKYASKVYQDYLKKYLRCVKGLDDNVKRLMDYLKEEGLLENTIIVYTSDQGFMLGEHDYIDKRWMYEESLRMPLFVRFPKSIPAGTRSDAMISNTDFAPTLIDLAGGRAPGYMQGRSFKQILHSGNEPEDWPKASYYRYWMHLAHKHQTPAHFGIRTKDFKLIFFYGRYWVDTEHAGAEWNRQSWGNDFDTHTPVAWELYDLRKDPMEMNNVYSDPEYREEVKDLKYQLELLRQGLNETDKA